MKLDVGDFSTIDWTKVPKIEHPGESGIATWQTVQRGDVRVRMVEYSPGYVADHWCSKGHVILVVKGKLTTELDDGRRVEISEGMCYTVRDAGESHRSTSATGAILFIID